MGMSFPPNLKKYTTIKRIATGASHIFGLGSGETTIPSVEEVGPAIVSEAASGSE